MEGKLSSKITYFKKRINWVKYCVMKGKQNMVKINPKINGNREFCTCKLDAMFKTVFVDEKNPNLLEALLSCILGSETHIVSWPMTFIPNTTAKEKAKTRDLVILVDGKYINLEVVTGHGKETRCQLFTYHVSMWKQNILQGEKYDTKMMFLQIVLQFGSSPNKSLMKEYKVQSIDDETGEISTWVKNFKIVEVNMERVKKLWYDNSREDIEKYKYLMMIDMDKEELKGLLKVIGSDEILEEYRDKVCNLNRNLNFVNTIGKEKEREYMFNTAVDLAREEGIEQGILETRLENAKSLIANGIDKNVVIKSLNLTEDEIKKLT